MRLQVGYGDETYGTVALTASGLRYAGKKPDAVKTLVESMRRENMSDKDLLNSLPKRLIGRVWAKERN